MTLFKKNRLCRTGTILLISSLAIYISGYLTVATTIAQSGPPRSGPGGPDAREQKIVKKFDEDGDGVLNKQEREAARKALQKNDEADSGRLPGRRDRPPGRRGRGGPPGMRGGERPTGSEGPQVSPGDVENFPDSNLYDREVLRTLFLEFENEDWEQELADFKPTDVEVPATLTVDGKVYPEVGVSFRGASSFFRIPKGSKRSLNLSMDYKDNKQRLYGYKTLNLLNCNGDSSMMSSLLYSHVARQKIAAPQVNFVRVVINGRSWGVYANAQQFNKDLLQENYGSSKGNRWKASGSPRGDAGLRYLGDDIEEYRSRFEIKSKDNEQAWKDLIRLCQVLDETPAPELQSQLDPILDIDGVLWFLAADIALINSDGYWTRASDYNLFQNADGKFHILPHDMNESFRASRGGPGGGGPGGRRGGRPFDRFGGPPPGNDNDRREKGERGTPEPPEELDLPRRPETRGSGYQLDPLIGLDQDRFPLRSKLLADPILKTRYLQHVRTIARDLIAWEKMGPQVAAARALIESEVAADTRKLMTWDSFMKATDNKAPAAPGSLQEFSEKRAAYLLSHPEIKNLPEQLVALPSDADRKK